MTLNAGKQGRGRQQGRVEVLPARADGLPERAGRSETVLERPVETWDVPPIDPKKPRVTVRPWHSKPNIQAIITMWLMGLLTGTIVWGAYQATGTHWAQAKEFLQMGLLAEVVSLLGVVVKHYFSSGARRTMVTKNTKSKKEE